MYQISARTQLVAKKIGVTVEPSTRKNKKIDVYKDGKRVASVGDSRYFDYHLYLNSKGKEYADERKRLYKIRHAKNLNKKGTPSYYADQLLWS